MRLSTLSPTRCRNFGKLLRPSDPHLYNIFVHSFNNYLLKPYSLAVFTLVVVNTEVSVFMELIV